MSDLPPGWEWTTVGEAGRVELGMARNPARHHGPNMKPYLRVANVFEGCIDVSDVKTMHFTPEEFNRYSLRSGDVLLNEGQSPELLGRSAVYKGEPGVYAFTNSLLRFQGHRDILPEWAQLVFRNHLHSGRFLREARITTNIAHLSAGRFKSIEFPVPPPAEQARIVEWLTEVRRSLLDVSIPVDRATTRGISMVRRTISGELDRSTRRVPRVTLGEIAAEVRNGIFVSRPGSEPDGVPILRISAVRPGELRRDDLRYTRLTRDELATRNALLREGDVLFTRYSGNTELVGASAVVRDPGTLTYPDKLIRVRVHPERIIPEYLMLACTFGTTKDEIREARRTTAGQVGISGTALKSVTIALPSLDVQRKVVDFASEIQRLADTATRSAARVSENLLKLEQSSLTDAFSGRFTS